MSNPSCERVSHTLRKAEEEDENEMNNIIHMIRSLHLEISKSDRNYSVHLPKIMNVYEQLIESKDCAGVVDTMDRFLRKRVLAGLVQRYGTSREEAVDVFEDIIRIARKCYEERAAEHRMDLAALRSPRR